MSDLSSLLGEGPADVAAADVAAFAGSAPIDKSPTVLDVDRWGRRRGEELAGQWSETEIADHPAEVVADAHASLFEPYPRPSDAPAEKQRAAWWDQLMNSPEYRTLHSRTCLDDALSALAAKKICDEWSEFVADHPEPEETDGEAGGDCPAPGSDAEPLRETVARVRSTSKALEAAAETVETARDLAEGLGLGGPGERLDEGELAKYFAKVRDDAFLRQIMAIAGRMRRLSQALQRTKTTHGRDDVVGIELGGDVSRLVPSELAQLGCGIPELELLAMDRLARRQALCRRYRGMERLGRGPLVVVVDESGSMQGDKITAAKALALALAWLARNQRRWIGLVGYSGSDEGTRIAFPPGGVDQDQLIDWLTHFYGGGSNRDLPIKELPAVFWPEFKAAGLPSGRTDVVMITDAVVECPDKMRDEYRAWAKAEQVTTYGIVVGWREGEVMKQIADRYWCVPSLDLDTIAVQSVLSI